VKKSLENRNSLTQRRKVAKQTKEFWLSDLCALAPLRDGFSFFHSFLRRGLSYVAPSELSYAAIFRYMTPGVHH
jgi:hypothetical protein